VLYLFLRFLFDPQQNDPHRHINMQMLHRTLDQSEKNQLRTIFMQSSSALQGIVMEGHSLLNSFFFNKGIYIPEYLENVPSGIIFVCDSPVK